MKTKSELRKELDNAVVAINALPGVQAEVIELHHCEMQVLIKKGAYGVQLGSDGISYGPNPDTREQALEKAQKLQREKEADMGVEWCYCDRQPGSSSYCVSWGPGGHSDVRFEFAETDEQ